MIIKNLTNKRVPLRSFVRTINGIVEMTKQISPKGETYIEEESTYPDLMRLYEEGVLSIDGKVYSAAEDIRVEDSTPESVADSTDKEGSTSETAPVVSEIADSITPDSEESQKSSEFNCPHCGAEFASSRGLQMHIKKSHPEVSE